MTSLDEVTSALALWSAEADSGQPVTDSQIVLLAEAGDTDGVAVALDLNRMWRRALGAGDRDALSAVLADAEEFTR